MSDTKEITPLEKNVTIATVVLGLIAFACMPFLTRLTDESPSDKSSEQTALHSQAASSSKDDHSNKVAQLENELEQALDREDVLQAELTDAREKYQIAEARLEKHATSGTATSGTSAQTPLATADSASQTTPAALATAPDSACNAAHPEHDARVKDLEGQIAKLTTAQASLAALTTRHDTLSSEFEKLKSSHTAATNKNLTQEQEINRLNQIVNKHDDLAHQKKTSDAIAALRKENTTLRMKLEKKNALTNKANETWANKYSNLEKTQKDLVAKNNLISKTNQDLQQQLNALRKTNSGLANQLRASQLNKPQQTPQSQQTPQPQQKQVFATSAAGLSPRLGTLFAKLKTLEGQSPTDLKNSYDTITRDQNASNLTRIKFGTGSITLKNSRRQHMREVLASAKPGESFLVVGYASNSGNKDVNQSLSSKRAKAVAAELINILGSNNNTQAVYLGETTRFGRKTENQCVEIWKVSQ